MKQLRTTSEFNADHVLAAQVFNQAADVPGLRAPKGKKVVWTSGDTWRPASGGNMAMKVQPGSMLLVIDQDGNWSLQYDVECYMPVHKWVYDPSKRGASMGRLCLRSAPQRCDMRAGRLA